jgi:hypothetical protein
MKESYQGYQEKVRKSMVDAIMSVKLLKSLSTPICATSRDMYNLRLVRFLSNYDKQSFLKSKRSTKETLGKRLSKNEIGQRHSFRFSIGMLIIRTTVTN